MRRFCARGTFSAPDTVGPVSWLRLTGCLSDFSTRDGARRLGLVRLEQMLQALTVAIESPCQGIRVLGVPEIRERPPRASSRIAVTL
jgi:hypothetical protein